MAFVSCGKDDEDTPATTTTTNNNQNPQDPPNPADDFVGDYMLNGTLTINLPEMIGGTQTQPINDIEISIERNGNTGDVKILMGSESYDGYVNNSGLHVDPIVINYPMGQSSLALTVTIPTISKPVNGETTCQASIMTTVSGITITGLADVVATKIN